jgi:uncharacterized protein YhaN
MATKDDLKELAQVREQVKKNKALLETLTLKLRDLPDYQEILRAQSKSVELSASQLALEEKIKNEGKVQFSEKTSALEGEEKEKAVVEFRSSLISGLALRINHFFDYLEADAIAWCETNAKAALKTVLDKKSFEALAEAQVIPGVKKIDVPTITIASDLSSYLAQAPAEPEGGKS